MTGPEKEGPHIGLCFLISLPAYLEGPKANYQTKRPAQSQKSIIATRPKKKKKTSAAAPTADTEIETGPQEYSSTPKGHVLHMTFFGPQFSVTVIASLWCILISLVLTVLGVEV